MATKAQIIDQFFRDANVYPWIHYVPIGEIMVAEVERMGPQGLFLSTAAAQIQGESWGKNLFGCDWDIPNAQQPPFCQVQVTPERVVALIRDGRANGVGYGQLTWPDYVKEAQRLGGAHLPDINMRVSFRIFNEHIAWAEANGLSWQAGAAAYNAGRSNWRAVYNTYGAAMVRRQREWAARLGKATGDDDDDGGVVDPEPGAKGFRIYIGYKDPETDGAGPVTFLNKEVVDYVQKEINTKADLPPKMMARVRRVGQDEEPDEPGPDKPTEIERMVEEAIEFGMKMIGTPYGPGWRFGTWPELAPLYSRIQRHDKPEWYRERFCICTGFINVLRYEIADLPAVGRRQGDNFPGGTAAFGRHLAFAEGTRPYPLKENTPRGWLVFSPYLGPALALQGHVGIALGNGKVLEARVPNLSANRTEDEGHRAIINWGGRGYTRIIPPEVWLRK